MPAPASEPQLHGLLRLLLRLRRPSPAVQRWLAGAGAAVFAVSLVVAVRNLPEFRPAGRWWWPSALAVVAGVVTLGANVGEFLLSARLAAPGRTGAPAAGAAALRVVLAGSVANMLPIPGAALVRTAALTARGSTALRAARTIAGTGVVWVGAGGLWTGAWLLSALPHVRGGATVAVIIIAAGAAAVVAGLAAAGARGTIGARLVALELASVAITTTRIAALSRAVGLDVAWPQAAALGLAAIVATALGVFPAGIGVREALSAGAAPLTGVPPAAGPIIAAADRVLMLVVAAAASALLLVRRGARA